MMATMLTTTDNPYDPFVQYDEWEAWDDQHGYNSCSLLARVTRTSDDLSPEEQETENERAIDEIVEQNVLGIYKKISKKV